MAVTVNVQEAKTRLSEVLARVERGERVGIARAGTPVAHLAAADPAPPRTFGIIELWVPDTFFEPLGSAELAAWE